MKQLCRNIVQGECEFTYIIFIYVIVILIFVTLMGKKCIIIHTVHTLLETFALLSAASVTLTPRLVHAA